MPSLHGGQIAINSTSMFKKMKIPLLERVSLNKFYRGMHWTERKRIADEWHLVILNVLREPKHRFIEINLKDYPLVFTYTFRFKKNPQDWLNCSGMVKLIEDGFVKGGLIIDDSPKYIYGGDTRVERTEEEEHVEVNCTKLSEHKKKTLVKTASLFLP